MIEVRNISKSFGALQVLNKVELNCRQGESIALIGPNGCGKTTLIKCILGMVIPTGGSIFFDGADIRNTFEYRRHIGYMPQIGRYPENMNVGQLIAMVKRLREEEVSRDEELLHAFQLPELYHKRLNTLSGGTTQKVSAALAFLFDPKVLILDEPTAGLDPVSAETLKEKIIQERKKGKLILITSHLLNELDELVTQIVFMQDGAIRLHHTIDELRKVTGEAKISRAIAAILKK